MAIKQKMGKKIQKQMILVDYKKSESMVFYTWTNVVSGDQDDEPAEHATTIYHSIVVHIKLATAAP